MYFAEIVNTVIVRGKTIHLGSIKKPTLTNKCDYVFFRLVVRSYFIGSILIMKDQFQNIRRGHSLQQGIAIIGFTSQINIELVLKKTHIALRKIIRSIMTKHSNFTAL